MRHVPAPHAVQLGLFVARHLKADGSAADSESDIYRPAGHNVTHVTTAGSLPDTDELFMVGVTQQTLLRPLHVVCMFICIFIFAY